MGNFDLKHIIEQCKKMHKPSQQLLFEQLYSFGHHICMRYAKTKEEADEVLSNAFLKVFLNIQKYDETYDFLPWFKKILINCSIDFIRQNKNKIATVELSIEIDSESFDEFEVDENIPLLSMLQQLPTMYQAVFNLYVMEEYSHEEIGSMLGINPSTSRSNLTRAKIALKKMIEQESMQGKAPLIRKLK
jgi:RNA polymerase sigma-70 factor, ECF subfamily